MKPTHKKATPNSSGCPPTVSVVVPCYNYARYLPQCVQSVLSQQGVDVDVFIIDDASTDNSGNVAETLADRDKRVTVVRHERNRGHIATYNEGLDLVTGKYCLLLSADDLLTPGALARATALLEANPRVGFAYGTRIRFAGQALPMPRTNVSGWSIWPGKDWIGALCRLGRNVLASPEVVLRTEIQHKIGPYRADLPHSGDMEMWLRAASVADVGKIDGADQAYYRVHADSMSQDIYYRIPLKDVEERKAAFTVAFEGLPGGVPGANELLSCAMRALASESLDLAISLQQTAVRDAGTAAGIEAAIAFALETCSWLTRSMRYRFFCLRERGLFRTRFRAFRRLDKLATQARVSYSWRSRQRSL